MTKLHVDLKENGYDINIGRHLLARAGEYFNLERKVIIVTDRGVPREYSEKIASCAREARIVTVEAGEGSKSLTTLEAVLSAMCDFELDRADAAVAVGGGVVGDLTGLAASLYMRGIDFYNVPTTLLSQLDSSVGGKTAVNFYGAKNIIGSFHQPRGVLIDTETLSTLEERQISAGLAEAVKMSLTSDAELFSLLRGLENTADALEHAEEIITAAIRIKKGVVEVDERESGLRRVLNFGHTLGHGIEALEAGKLYHGECVALGMLPFCSKDVRELLTPTLARLGLPTEYRGSIDRAIDAAKRDKKSINGNLRVITVDRIGDFKEERITKEDFAARVKLIFG